MPVRSADPGQEILHLAGIGNQLPVQVPGIPVDQDPAQVEHDGVDLLAGHGASITHLLRRARPAPLGCSRRSSRTLVVKTTAGKDDPERCNQAFTVAATAVASGLRVSLWLTGEAAWLGLPDRAGEVALPHSAPLADLLATILADGTVTVCTQCAARRDTSQGAGTRSSCPGHRRACPRSWPRSPPTALRPWSTEPGAAPAGRGQPRLLTWSRDSEQIDLSVPVPLPGAPVRYTRSRMRGEPPASRGPWSQSEAGPEGRSCTHR